MDNFSLQDKATNWSFDVFHLNTMVEGHVLTYMGVKIFQRHKICDQFNVSAKNALEKFTF